jgi:KUP system potassium uptake protein
MLEKSKPYQVEGTAVFLTSDPDNAPPSLLHNLKHNKVLHRHNVVLTVKTDDAPRIADDKRVALNHIGGSFWRVSMTYGYMETPDIPAGLALLRLQGRMFDFPAASFFLSRRAIRPSARSTMPFWQDKLFVTLAKSASDATEFFHIPPSQVVEVGTQVAV